MMELNEISKKVIELTNKYDIPSEQRLHLQTDIVQALWETQNAAWTKGYNQGKDDPDYEGKTDRD